jgi:hypothetical protein
MRSRELGLGPVLEPRGRGTSAIRNCYQVMAVKIVNEREDNQSIDVFISKNPYRKQASVSYNDWEA